MTRRNAFSFALRYTLYRLRKDLTIVRRDKSGVAAVEFALLLPLMLLLYIGTAELTTGLMANRKMTLVARAAADLIAQEEDDSVGITNTTLTNIYNSAAVIMAPFSTTTLKFSASSIKFVPKTGAPASNPQYKAMTVWTIGNKAGATKRPCGESAITQVPNTTAPSSSTMPAGLYQAGTVIVADVEYVFTPNFGGSLLSWSSTDSSITMKHTSYMKPRAIDEVKYTESTPLANATVCNPAPPSSWS